MRNLCEDIKNWNKNVIMDKFNFNLLNEKCTMSYDLVQNRLYKILTPKNKIPPIIGTEVFIYKHNLVEFFENILYYTSFLPKESNIIEKLYCVHNNIHFLPSCLICHEKVKFIGFTKGYTKYCSYKCNGKINHVRAHLSEDQIKAMHTKIGEKRRGFKLPPYWRDKLSIAANKEEVKAKKRNTNLIKYGVENPGVLGAHSSKTAYNYIVEYIDKRGYDPRQCFFKNNYPNDNEFFQMIFNNNLSKYEYCSYDLVVFDSIQSAKEKCLFNIIDVLEYNGPWHYKIEDVSMKDFYYKKAVPYLNNNKTISQVFWHDYLKLEHMYQYCQNINIYWEKSKELQKFILYEDLS